MRSGLVDLRSDTVTHPTAEMRRAMANAEVGDDQYGEDPTVNALEQAFAERVGKEAAIFTPSGTMANQIALQVLCPRGRSVVAGRRQHVVIFEGGAAPANAGVQFHTVDDSDGCIDPEDLAWALRAADHHQVRPGLVCVEQTHMPSGGMPYPLDRLVDLLARAEGLPLHMDGARLFNAAVAMDMSAAALAAPATTVMSCLSKGLCAPVGSVLAGPADAIDEARRVRQRMGGAMRQAGVLAAAGLVALHDMVERLAEDHARARKLAELVADRWPDSGCDPVSVRTNMVVFRHSSTETLVEQLEAQGILVGSIAPGVMRMVTHHDIDDGDLAKVAQALSVI